MQAAARRLGISLKPIFKAQLGLGKDNQNADDEVVESYSSDEGCGNAPLHRAHVP
jgi:hypothetical protein